MPDGIAAFNEHMVEHGVIDDEASPFQEGGDDAPPSGVTAGKVIQMEPEGYNECDATSLFLQRSAPIRCVGKDWYVYDEGAWSERPRSLSAKLALSIIPKSLRTERRAQQILSHAEAEQQVPHSALRGFYRMDGKAVLVNCANGVLKITPEAVELREHDQEHYFTLKTAAKYDAEATCPKFLAVLHQSLPDAIDRDLLSLFCGSFLLPSARLETACDCYGHGGTGKSTLMDSVANALGPGLVTRLSMQQLCDQEGYNLPLLERAAVNLGTELDSLEVEDGSSFKALVSGEAIQCRRIYREPIVMRSTAKLMFLSNDLPRFKHGTDGERRRMRFIRFEHKPEKPDTSLKDQLLAERDGIFNWMVAGLQRVLTMDKLPNGGDPSAAALARFSVSNDPVGAFVADRCVVDTAGKVEKAMIANEFSAFLEEFGLSNSLKDSFFKRLYDRFPSIKGARVRGAGDHGNFVTGIRFKEDDEEEA